MKRTAPLVIASACILSSQTFAQQTQWAANVIAYSSQWSTPQWAAFQATGAPDTYPSYGDIPTAWASLPPDASREFITLGYTTPQKVNQINIYETYNPGAIDTIYLRDVSNSQWVQVWSGTAFIGAQQSNIFTVNIPLTSFNADAIRIAVNSGAVPGWNEIDAVQIVQTCTVQITQQIVSCYGACDGSATASPTGTSPYTYSWSTTPVQTTATATGLCAGNYSVTVTDANTCVVTASVNITQPTQLGIISQSQQNVTCNNSCNGVAQITVSGGITPYSYGWAPSSGTASTATGLCAGTYSVTVTDDYGCMVSTSFLITQPPQLLASITTVPASCSACCDGSATANVSGGTLPYSFVWTTSPLQYTQTATGLCCPGPYTVTVSDGNNCTATAYTLLSCLTGIEGTASHEDLSIFPNPANDHLTIEGNIYGKTQVYVFNILGERVLNHSFEAKGKFSEQLDIRNLSRGTYFAEILSADRTRTLKFVKE